MEKIKNTLEDQMQYSRLHMHEILAQSLSISMYQSQRIHKGPSLSKRGKCVYPNCTNTATKYHEWNDRPCDIHFAPAGEKCQCQPPFKLYNFPQKGNIYRNEWIRIVAPSQDWQPRNDHFICSLHFKDGEPMLENPCPMKLYSKTPVSRNITADVMSDSHIYPPDLVETCDSDSESDIKMKLEIEDPYSLIDHCYARRQPASETEFIELCTEGKVKQEEPEIYFETGMDMYVGISDKDEYCTEGIVKQEEPSIYCEYDVDTLPMGVSHKDEYFAEGIVMQEETEISFEHGMGTLPRGHITEGRILY